MLIGCEREHIAKDQLRAAAEDFRASYRKTGEKSGKGTGPNKRRKNVRGQRDRINQIARRGNFAR